MLPEEARHGLPALYSQETQRDPVVHLKFFTPDAGWTWFVAEGQPDGEDFRFFGFVIGLEEEWGTASSPNSAPFAARRSAG